MASFVFKVPLGLAFKVKNPEGNLYRKVMCPGDQTAPCPDLLKAYMFLLDPKNLN